MTGLKVVGLLILSNIFMTFAWYGHLKFKTKPLVAAVLISWSIALLEYCFQVPANRLGHGYFTAPQLKTIQEVITFIIFAIFSVAYLKEKPTYYDGLAFLLIAAAVAISVFQPRV